MTPRAKENNFGIYVLSVFILIFSLLLIYRLFDLQVKNRLSAEGPITTDTDTNLNRATIYFSDKDGKKVSAAVTSYGFRLSINPQKLGDELKTFRALEPYIDLSEEEFMERAMQKEYQDREIKRRVTKENANNIEELDLDGVYLRPFSWRTYPGNELASQVIGFVGSDGSDLVGRYGLERYYENTLSIESESGTQNAFLEIFSDLSSLVRDDDDSADLITTIEPSVQSFVESIIFDVAEKYRPEDISAMIINPQNGEILAMANYPNFNVNEFNKVEDNSIFPNNLVEKVYEFGSVVKPLVIAAGIDAGVIEPDTPFYDSGSVQVEDKEIKNFDGEGRGQITIRDVLAQSLNTGMVYTMKQLGRDKFRDYMLSYRLGEKTNIDLPNEASGFISNLYEPRDLEYATASFGQGISFPATALVRALSTVANGGYLIRPHVVREVDYLNKNPQDFDFRKEDGERVISLEASKKTTDILVYFVDNELGYGRYSNPGYSVAAKTGTAQIPNQTDGGYYEDRNRHSFVGYFPAYDPKFLVFLTMNYPKGARYASETLAPAFFEINKFLVNYYEIPPDRSTEEI